MDLIECFMNEIHRDLDVLLLQHLGPARGSLDERMTEIRTASLVIPTLDTAQLNPSGGSCVGPDGHVDRLESKPKRAPLRVSSSSGDAPSRCRIFPALMSIHGATEQSKKGLALGCRRRGHGEKGFGQGRQEPAPAHPK